LSRAEHDLTDGGRPPADAVTNLDELLATLAEAPDLTARLKLLQHQTIGIQHIRALAGINPPTFMDVGIDSVVMFHQPLNGVGDL